MSGKSHEKVAGFVRNGWQPPAGMAGRSTPESVAGYGRILQNPYIAFNGKGEIINTGILEYTSGQLVMQISFIIVCLFNGIYYLFIK